MRKLRSFGVNSDMLVTFYNSVISSFITFGSVCWGGNISKLDRGRLGKIVKKAGHVVGKLLDSFKTLYEKRRFGLTEKALFQVILGLLGISIRSFLLVYADCEKGGVRLSVCMCVCFMT